MQNHFKKLSKLELKSHLKENEMKLKLALKSIRCLIKDNYKLGTISLTERDHGMLVCFYVDYLIEKEKLLMTEVVTRK